MRWGLARFPMSWQAKIIFWWTTFLLIQQTERLFLLPETFAHAVLDRNAIWSWTELGAKL